ncbi:MAG TPA: phosphoribosyltransferase family protein [Candidatus Paceibacterota bacterium]
MKFFALIQSALDVLLPRHERSVRADTYTLSDLHVYPSAHDLCDISITTLADYRNKAVEDCIRALKYNNSEHSAILFSEILADYLQEELATKRTFSSRVILIVPIPLHAKREYERGFNQADSVIQKLPSGYRNGELAAHAPTALIRVKNTKPQTHLSRALRLTNMSGAFSADEKIVPGTHVFLIDDVATTGATLAEATRTLEKVGATVTPIALARA